MAVAAVVAAAESSGCLRSEGGEPPSTEEPPAINLDLLAAAAAVAEASGDGDSDDSVPTLDVLPCSGVVEEIVPVTACLAAGGSSLEPPPA